MSRYVQYVEYVRCISNMQQDNIDEMYYEAFLVCR